MRFVPVALKLQHNCCENAYSNIGHFLSNFPTMINSLILSSPGTTTLMFTRLHFLQMLAKIFSIPLSKFVRRN